MKISRNQFFKLWGMPLLLAVISLAGLLFAIAGTGLWHVLSWVALSIPVYVMFRYGIRFYR